eukprot:7088029-Pyramimonas_sp.AAC.1
MIVASWGVLGVALGGFLGHLGGLSGCPGAFLCALERPCGVSEHSWALLGASWSFLELWMP